MEMKDFIVNVGPRGTFRPSGKYNTTVAHIDELFERYHRENVQKITIYFHGGLVNEKNGIETAIAMEKVLSEVGQTPVCFVWETGLMETVSSNFSKLSETKLFEKLIKLLTKKLASKLGFELPEGRGAEGTLSEEDIELELCQETPFANYTREMYQSSGRGAGEHLLTSQELLEAEFMFDVQGDTELISILIESEQQTAAEKPGARGIFSTAKLVKHMAIIAFRVIKRFIAKRDHDFYPTIMEELCRELYVADLGAWVWNNMKIKSEEMWQSNVGKFGKNQLAGRYFFDKLKTYHQENPSLEVNLVGHSAGSIAICNLLKMSTENYPELKYNQILFMAPACRIDLFTREIVDHPERFTKFRMFTMTDENEKKDRLLPYVYTHSLLYLISGILENQGNDFDAPILGLERHIDPAQSYEDYPEVKVTHEFLFNQAEKKVVFSQTEATALDGLRTHSLAHGDFDNDSLTLQSIQFLLR